MHPITFFCCERAQQKNRIHRMGSERLFVAQRINDRVAGQTGLMLMQLSLLQHSLATAAVSFLEKSEIYTRPVVQSHHTQLFDTSQFSPQNSGL